MTVASLSVLLTTMIASVSYIGAVRESALVSLLMPLVLLVGLVTMWLRERPLRALAAALGLALLGGEVVNVASGSFQGSVARGAAGAAVLTGVAIVASGGRRPAWFLVPVSLNLAWALALGAGGRVQLISLLTAGAAAVALTLVETESRRYEVAPRLAPSAVVAVVLIAAAGVFVTTYQRHHDGRQAASPFRSSLASTISPPAVLSLSKHPPPSATQVREPSAQPKTAAPRRSRLAVVLVLLAKLIAVLCALIFLGALAWLVWVDLTWPTAPSSAASPTRATCCRCLDLGHLQPRSTGLHRCRRTCRPMSS